MDRDTVINYLKKFKAEKQNHYHIERLGVFGSVAKNEAHDNSDIDIVVKLTCQDLFELIGIKQELEEAFNAPVDVVSYRDRMNSFLKKRIDAEAVYV